MLKENNKDIYKKIHDLENMISWDQGFYEGLFLYKMNV